MKRLLLIFISILLATPNVISGGHRRDGYHIKTVVIDAGHGGHDTGCLGSSSREKMVALDIALKLGKQIEQNYPDIKVIYTRKTDVFVPLHERANIANRAKADLFICIHLNSGGKGAYGSETYVMGLHKSEDNLNVAKRENASVLLEDDYKTQYDGFDPNSPEANIIFSLYQNQFMHQSLSFAANVQEEFEEYAGRYNRGVKQAGFLVLYKTAMPSVLIECGFLSHDLEEKFLNAEKGQSTMATSIFRAFKAYKLDMESGSTEEKPAVPVLKVDPDTGSKAVATIPQPKPEIKKDTPPEDQPKLEEVKPSKPEEKPIPKVVSPTVIKPQPVQVKENKPEPKPISIESNIPSVYIAVQIGASTNAKTDAPKFLKVKGVRGIVGVDGYTRFVVGTFKDAASARIKLNELKANGFKDAFLTAFKAEQRITVNEAEQMLKRP